MKFIIFHILRDRLVEETHSCRWCMHIPFLNLARSLIADCLPVFIDLARLSVRLDACVHLYCCILAGMLLGDILISSSDSLGNQLACLGSTSRAFSTHAIVVPNDKWRNGYDKRIFNWEKNSRKLAH